MITFYGIIQAKNFDLLQRSKSIKNACNKRNVKYIELVAEEINNLSLPILDKYSLLYNIGRGFDAQTLESLLLCEKATTFYKKNPLLNDHISTNHLNIILQKNNIPMPATVYSPTTERHFLKGYVDQLHGFPIVIKVSGESAGLGVLKVDSFGGLYSIVDYLANNRQHFVFKQYIQAKSSVRTVVLGDTVIAAAEFFCDPDEFRSNTSLGNHVQRDIVDPGDNMKSIALNAVHALNLEFGAVDFIIDQENNPYVLEVNFPFNFIPKNPLGGSWPAVADKMVEYLLNKQSLQLGTKMPD